MNLAPGLHTATHSGPLSYLSRPRLFECTHRVILMFRTTEFVTLATLEVTSLQQILRLIAFPAVLSLAGGKYSIAY